MTRNVLLIHPSSLILHPSASRFSTSDWPGPPRRPRKPRSRGSSPARPRTWRRSRRPDGPIDHRCDLFSLGCVLYRVCTGELPFKGVKPLTILWSLAVTQPPPPRKTQRRGAAGAVRSDRETVGEGPGRPAAVGAGSRGRAAGDRGRTWTTARAGGPAAGASAPVAAVVLTTLLDDARYRVRLRRCTGS